MTRIPSKFLTLRLQDVQTISPRVKQFTLAPADNMPLPAFSGGSHIIVNAGCSGISFRNAYSLIGSPDRNASYQIAVQLSEQSRGGSLFFHGLELADVVFTTTFPSNTFPLVHTARRHVFIAGGIGITPFLTFIEDAESAGIPWELHYAVRSWQSGAFVDRLRRDHPKQVVIYASDERRLSPHSILQNQKLGTHVYACGPDRLIAETSASALALGWPERSIHYEHFQSSSGGNAFIVELARSGKTVSIDSGVSLLEALEAAGMDVPYGCRAGACGACETAVLSGTPDHHDHYLSDDEKSSGKSIMPCVSRSRSERLVLDL